MSTTATTTAERTARMLRDLAAAERQRAESYDHPLAEKDLEIAEARAKLCELEDERRDLDARREYHCEVADELERLADEQAAAARPVPDEQALADATPPPDPDGDLGGPDPARGVWSDLDAPGGYVCGAPVREDQPGIPGPDGPRICGVPVESEPCHLHPAPGQGGPGDPPGPHTGPRSVVPDPDGHPAWQHIGAPTPEVEALESGAPLTTLTDPPPIPTSHAAPRTSTDTGRFRALITGGLEKVGLVHREDGDDRDGDDQ